MLKLLTPFVLQYILHTRDFVWVLCSNIICFVWADCHIIKLWHREVTCLNLWSPLNHLWSIAWFDITVLRCQDRKDMRVRLAYHIITSLLITTENSREIVATIRCTTLRESCMHK